MKDGTKIRIKDMSDAHLGNTIRMLERKHESDLDMAMMGFASLQGEMASYYAEQELENMWDAPSLHPIYYDLLEEQRRRNDKIGKKWGL